MSRVHTDAEMLLASQIAYLNINPGPGGHPVNISEWIRQQKAVLKHSNVPGAQDQLNAIKIIEEMLSREDFGISMEDFSKWTVIDSCDHNSTTGMYGSVIDTGDGNAIIGFRGTESYTGEQITNDISRADLALLDNVLTDQQADAQAYTGYVYEKYKEKYDQYDITGHSLGGNLAEHSAITSDPDMEIGRVTNYDGPGFSDEYISIHGSEIAARKDIVDHFAYSWVGALLIPLPGTNYLIIDAEGEGFGRHMADNIIIRNGQVVYGSRDSLSEFMSTVSKTLEILPTGMLGFAVCVLVEFIQQELSIINATVDWIMGIVNDILTADAEFSINTQGIYDVSERFRETGDLSASIAEEVRNIARSLGYDSIGSSYVKHKLFLLSYKIEGDARSSRDLSAASEFCANHYTESDRNAGSLLTV